MLLRIMYRVTIVVIFNITNTHTHKHLALLFLLFTFLSVHYSFWNVVLAALFVPRPLHSYAHALRAARHNAHCFHVEAGSHVGEDTPEDLALGLGDSVVCRPRAAGRGGGGTG